MNLQNHTKNQKERKLLSYGKADILNKRVVEYCKKYVNFLLHFFFKLTQVLVEIEKHNHLSLGSSTCIILTF